MELIEGLTARAGGVARGTESCGELQARCGKTVAARMVFAGFGAPDGMEKRAAARTYAVRRGEIIIWDVDSSVN